MVMFSELNWVLDHLTATELRMERAGSPREISVCLSKEGDESSCVAKGRWLCCWNLVCLDKWKPLQSPNSCFLPCDLEREECPSSCSWLMCTQHWPLSSAIVTVPCIFSSPFFKSVLVLAYKSAQVYLIITFKLFDQSFLITAIRCVSFPLPSTHLSMLSISTFFMCHFQ